MASRQVRRQMQRIAIERVLARRGDRAAIGSLADLRTAYQSELAVNQAEIEAEANALMARFRQFDANFLALATCAAPRATAPSKTQSG